MVLVWLLIIPAAGAVLAWASGRWQRDLPRWISLVVLLADLLLGIGLWVQRFGQIGIAPGGPWLYEVDLPWIPQLGITFHLAMDGLSLLLVLLTAFMGLIAVLASWVDIDERIGFFHFNLLWILMGITGVFISIDLFLFYFFWEMMLVPMYLIIALWGHERRVYASFKFFLFTQASGLLMLVAILALYFFHGQSTGVYTFDYAQLLRTSLPPAAAWWLMLGFLIAFLVKLPAVPVHTWLPDAHTEAPTGGSIILASLMLKTGAYGILRFVVPLFPQAAFSFAPIAMVLAVIGILYGAMLAFAQTDLKRLVAYTSVSHMGFVLLGIFAWNELALQGAVMQILTHGISTGALFAVVGVLSDRIHTRDMRRMGGLWETVPRMGAVALYFALGALGLPGLGNFVGEFLVLLGTFPVNPILTVIATIGLVVATVYSLWMVQVAFQGPNKEGWKLPDLSGREWAMMAPLILVLLWLGLFPQPVLNTASQSLSNLQRVVPGQTSTSGLVVESCNLLQPVIASSRERPCSSRDHGWMRKSVSGGAPDVVKASPSRAISYIASPANVGDCFGLRSRPRNDGSLGIAPERSSGAQCRSTALRGRPRRPRELATLATSSPPATWAGLSARLGVTAQELPASSCCDALTSGQCLGAAQLAPEEDVVSGGGP